MNEIIHSSAKLNDPSTLKNEDEIIQSIFQCIDRIFSIVRPRILLYMAIDGVAPKAKMHQQRSKRFLDARKQVFEAGRFNKCDIKPGTEFMSKLSNHLRSYICDRMSTNPAWRSIIVILSDANVPDEGEHKIMDFIRVQLSHKPSVIHHVLFSADSDMVLLGLTTHSNHFQIMREKSQPPNDETKQYVFIDLKVLRLEIENDLKKDIQPSPRWDVERMIDDWVLLCFLGGNDFLPYLPSIEFNKGDLDTLTNIYREHVLNAGGYLTEGVKPNMEYLKKILKHIGDQEHSTIKTRHLDLSHTSLNYSLGEVRHVDFRNLSILVLLLSKDIKRKFGDSAKIIKDLEIECVLMKRTWQSNT